MKIICKSNDIYTYSGKVRHYLTENVSQSEGGLLALTPGKEYVVYGIEIIDGYPWYYLCDDGNAGYPWPYPAPLFDVSDGRISTYWSYKHKMRVVKDTVDLYTHFTFKDWLDDDFFADRLLDGGAREMNIFQQYKKKMDCE